MREVARALTVLIKREGLTGVARRVRQAAAWKELAIRVGAMTDQRLVLSKKYLKGTGIEIGALMRPLPVSERASVIYVDRLPESELKTALPEVDAGAFVKVDIVDDGERLSQIEDESQDFIIANHMIEHCEDPLGTLARHLSRLKSGGVLFYAMPDKRYTFDADRPLTTFDHLVKDKTEGPQQSRWQHYQEWVELVMKRPDPNAKLATRLMQTRGNIHFHVWDRNSFVDFLDRTRVMLGVPFEVLEVKPNGREFIVILRKRGQESA